MFETKQKSLMARKSKIVKSANKFLFGAGKETAKTLSDNGALKYITTNSDWVDQFGKISTYKAPRSFADISADCETLWAQDEELCVKFIVYIRMISRKTNLYGLNITTSVAQSGAELKHEGIMRMLWLSTKAPKTFFKNIGLFISAGSCKDIITMLRYDLVYHGWDGRTLDWNRFGQLILSLLNEKTTVNLMKKYLPIIRATSKCNTVDAQANTMIGKWICSLLFNNKNNESATYAKYRRLKSSGTAHEWQQLISRKDFKSLDFGKIHGRALSLLVKSKFLKRHNLQEKYAEWIGKVKSVKYTGFIHELLCTLSTNRDSLYTQTVDKQFSELVEKSKSGENHSNIIVVRDISGSMLSTAVGTSYSSADISKALAIYFSEFLSGPFAGHCINFSSKAELHKWRGATASQKWRNDSYRQSANTNFQSVVNLFCKMKSDGVPESDFPNGMLCLSDGEFDAGFYGKTNIETMRMKFTSAGFSEEFIDTFKVIFWDLPNLFFGRPMGGPAVKFETFGDVKNVFYMSGYSASNVKFILNQKVETAQDLFNTAMDQELLNLIKV